MNSGGGFAKRAFDFSVALTGFLILSPLFLLIAILIKVDTRGPVFFRQERSGLDGEPFKIFKFRTMIVGAFRSGARLTVKRDPRITNVGGVLRWTKLDELPQLLNVIKGDMALVGPRPEDPYFVSFYDEEQRIALSVRPGIIGPSQIDGRDETEKYPDDVENVEEFYIRSILPEKLATDVAYARNAGFWSDLKFLIGGFFHVLLSQVKEGFFDRQRYRMAMMVVDILFMALAYVLSYYIHWEGDLQGHQLKYMWRTLPLVVLVTPAVFLYYGVYQRTITWVGRRDLSVIVKAVSVSLAILVGLVFITGNQDHSRAIFIIHWTLLTAFVAGSRYVMRYYISRKRQAGAKVEYVKILVAGSGHGGETILRSLLEDPNSQFMPVGIIDHEPRRWGALIHGVRVMGGATDIAMAASTHGVEMVLISMADLDPVVIREITDACEKLKLQYRLVPALSDMLARETEDGIATLALSPQGKV